MLKIVLYVFKCLAIFSHRTLPGVTTNENKNLIVLEQLLNLTWTIL